MRIRIVLMAKIQENLYINITKYPSKHKTFV